MIKDLFKSYFSPDISKLMSREARQSRTLNILLVSSAGIALSLFILILLITTLYPDSNLVGVSVEDRSFIFAACWIACIGALTIWGLQRFLSANVRSFLFLWLLLTAIFASDSLTQIIHGRSSYLLFIPVMVSSVILYPWAGFVTALLSTLISIIGAYTIVHSFPNVPAILCMFFFASVIYQSRMGMERALEHLEKVNKSLEESEERYRRLVNFMPVGIVLHRQYKIQFANPAAAKMLGTDEPGALIGTSIMERIPPLRRDIASQTMKEKIASNNPSLILDKLVRMDGQVFDAEISTLNIEDNGSPATLAIINDVSRRKQAEDAQRESEERFRILSALNLEGIMIHENGAIVDANQAFADLFGCKSADELIGKHGWDFLPMTPESRVALKEHFGARLTTPYEITIIRPDGSTFPAETQGWDINYQGRTVRVVALRDLTERKKIEEAITRQNQRLQEVSRQLVEVQEREKHLLAAELHDDLGQSLTTLKVLLELADSRSEEKRRKAVEDARALLAELMGKVRNISLDLRPAMLDDFGLSAGLHWLFDRFHTQTGINIHARVNIRNEQRFDPRIEITAFRIIQEALTNIVRHASVRDVKIDIDVNGNLSIIIQDEGQGFNINEFWQQHAASGGISGMQERARLAGGYVTIESERGKGTRVIAEIPLQSGETA